MSKRFFITGTGTGIGKTVVSAIVAEALHADYWKPVQAGFEDGTDSEWVAGAISNKRSVIHRECYRLKLPASPHIAAREENTSIDISAIVARAPAAEHLVIEGAGGLMVPLNNTEFICDLIRSLNVRVILVSRNELGSINHSLLTAMACKQNNIDVAGWIFNGKYLDYEEEICHWTGIRKIASIPESDDIGKSFILEQAAVVREKLKSFQ